MRVHVCVNIGNADKCYVVSFFARCDANGCNSN